MPHRHRTTSHQTYGDFRVFPSLPEYHHGHSHNCAGFKLEHCTSNQIGWEKVYLAGLFRGSIAQCLEYMSIVQGIPGLNPGGIW